MLETTCDKREDRWGPLCTARVRPQSREQCMRFRRTTHLTFSSVAALVVVFGCTVMGSAPQAQRQGDWIDVHVHLFAGRGALADFDEARIRECRAALQAWPVAHRHGVMACRVVYGSPEACRRGLPASVRSVLPLPLPAALDEPR